MNREQFILQLKQELSGMPAAERQRAIEYYENYFDEAGVENEAEVLRDLGTPKKVAADILKDFSDISVVKKRKKRSNARDKFFEMENGQKLLLIVFIAVGIVCILPVCVGMIGGIGGILIGLIFGAAAIFLCVPLLAITMWFCAAAAVIAAIVYAVKQAVIALWLIGVALICAGVGMLLWKLTKYLFGTVFPKLFSTIWNRAAAFFHNLLYKK